MKKNSRPYRLAILVAAICFGLIPIFGQALTNLGIPSFKQTFFMELFSFLIITPLYFSKLKQKLPRRQDLLFFLLFGAVLFLVNFLPLTAIALSVPVALVTLLVYIHPGITLFVSRAWFQEKITAKKTIYVAIALIGVIELLKSSQLVTGKLSLLGLTLALLGGITMSLWTCFGKESGARGYGPFDTLYWSAAGAVILLIITSLGIFQLPVLAVLGPFDFSFIPLTLVLLLAMAFITTVIGHTLFFWGINKISAVEGSVIALFEPTTAIFLSFLLFGQNLSLSIVLGGMLILLTSILISLE